jgi:excisionase family DNA binding protein
MSYEKNQKTKSNLISFELEGFNRSQINTNNTNINVVLPLPKNYIVKEVADFLRCKSDTVYKMIKKREIPYHKIKGKILFEKTKFHEWYDSFAFKTADEITQTA